MDVRQGQVTLLEWVRSSLLRVAVVPLLLIEAAILVAYGVAAQDQFVVAADRLQDVAKQDVLGAVRGRQGVVNGELVRVEQLVALLRGQMEASWNHPFSGSVEERRRYAEEGVMHYSAELSSADVSMYYSGLVPVDEARLSKAARLARFDTLLRDVVATDPLITQAFFNTPDGLNRIHPGVAHPGTWPQGLDVTAFPFFFMADGEHNPDRGLVWLDAYVDPAGAGWVVSCIAPVWVDGVLEAVVGVDLRLHTIIEDVLALRTPFGGSAMLVSADGKVIAVEPRAAEVWPVETPELDQAFGDLGDEAPPVPNLHEHPQLGALMRDIDRAEALSGVLDLDGDHVFGWAVLPSTGWRVVFGIEADRAAHLAEQLRQRSWRLLLSLLGAVVVFYVVFMWMLIRRSRAEAARLAAPLLMLERMTIAIGDGEYDMAYDDVSVAEIDGLGRGIQRLGHQLGEQFDRLRQVEDARRRALTTLTAGVAHEVNTPLGVAVTAASLVEEHLQTLREGLMGVPPSPDAALSSASQLEAANALVVANLQRASERVQLFKSVAGEHARDETRPVDLVAFLRYAVASIMPMIGSRDVRVTVEGAEDVRLCTRPGALVQLVANVVENALRHAFPDDRRGRVWFRVWPHPEGACLVIEDDGVGMPPAVRSRALEPFFTTASGRGGSGLGLFIVSNLVVEALRGSIEVGGREQGGTRLIVTLGALDEGDG